MSFLKSLFALDLFGVPLFINFKNRKKRSSPIGLFFSLVLIGYLVYQFQNSDIFKRSHPFLVRETIETSGESISIVFKPSDLITFHVSDRYNRKFIDPTMFTFTFQLYYVIANQTTKQMQPVYALNQKLVPCTLAHVGNDSTLYDSLGLTNSLCLNNISFPLKGYLNELTNYYVASDLIICNNATSNGTCKPLNTIYNFFASQTMYYAVSFHSVVVDSSNYQNPLKTKMIDINQIIDIKIMKKLNIFFKNVQLTTDDGIVLPNSQDQWEFSFDSLQQDIQSRTSDSMQLVMMRFWGTNRIDKITRRYEKLPETLGQLVGMANLFMFFGFLITNMKTNFQTMKIILNKLYLIPPDKVKKTKSKIIKKSGEKNDLKLKQTKLGKTISLQMAEKESKRDDSGIWKLKDAVKEDISPNKSLNSVSSGLKFTEIILKNQSKAEIAKEPKTIQFNNSSNDKNDRLDLSKLPQKGEFDDSFILEHYSINDIEKQEKKNKAGPSDILSEKRESKDEVSSKKKFKRQKTTLSNMNDKLAKYFRKNTESPESTENKTKNFHFLDYFTHKLLKKNKKISKLERVYNKEIDIVRILKVLHEVENLKLILLDEDQYLLFNSIVKPYILFDNEEEPKDNPLLRSKSSLLKSPKENRI